VSIPSESLLIASRRLAAFSDRVVLRDPRACSRRPSLVAAPGGLEARGPFQVRLQSVVDRDRGVRFADATGDPNPIHREGEVVPGAYLAARMVSALEILFPRLGLERLRVSFTGVCWYDRALRLTLRCRPVTDGAGAAGLEVDAVAFQDQREVARATLAGRLLAETPALELPLEKVDAAWLMRVVEFYRALGVDAEAWFHKDAGSDLSYPIAFLASLPSGSMVERFSGHGGILNRLTLEFQAAKLPLAGPPEVDLEISSRLRRSFNRIMTTGKEGMQAAVRGTALVLPRPPADVLSRPE